MSQTEFSNTVTTSGYQAPTLAQYNAFSSQLPTGGITTTIEACMFLANVIHETGGLLLLRESCSSNNCAGSYPCQGTCSNCPAGQYYYGRGYIQLSWCYNYMSASQALYNDERLYTNPDQVASDENTAWATAFWFWKANVHNQPGISAGEFGVSTRAINSMECSPAAAPYSEAKNRYLIYQNCFKACGLSNPIENGCYN